MQARTMPLRIAIAGLSHETSTYADDITGRTGLDAFARMEAGQIIETYAGTRSYPAGMLDAAAAIGAEAVPAFLAVASPSGTITADAYGSLRASILASLDAAGPLDAVALELHGAGMAEGVDDLEGDLAAAVRAVVGPDVPIVASFDLHGNVTDAMGVSLDLWRCCRLYPHEDMYETGRALVERIPDLVARRLRPVTWVEHLPMLLPPATTDPGFPAHEMNTMCAEVQSRPGIVACTVFHGFPFSDSPHAGVHVVVAADRDRGAARCGARDVASWVWSNRERFLLEALTPSEAVERALAVPEGPVVVNDTADNPGGGAPGDGTYVLRAFLDADVAESCFAFVCDPETVRAAMAAGVGARVPVRLGGKHGALHGAPIEADAYVRCLTDGRFQQQAYGAGLWAELGPMARLVIGNVDVLVSSIAAQTFDPEVFALHGIDVRRYRLVGLKSSQHFRAGFRDIATAIVTADSPGLTTLRVDRFERARGPGPMWPVDPDASYEQ